MQRLSPRVVLAIDHLFPPESRDRAAEILPRSADLPFQPQPERIHLAILTLSEGELAKLAQLADNARRDWRDVLYWAEYTEPGRALYEPLMAEIEQRHPGGEA